MGVSGIVFPLFFSFLVGDTSSSSADGFDIVFRREVCFSSSFFNYLILSYKFILQKSNIFWSISFDFSAHTKIFFINIRDLTFYITFHCSKLLQ